MKALLTGGAGFIGSHLAERLLELGHEVHVLDNLSTGSIDNIAHLKGRAGFSYVIDTVTNEHLHLVPELEQPLRQVRSDEPGAAGQKGSHASIDPLPNAWMASATLAACRWCRRACNGNDNSSAAARAATGQSRGARCANAGCLCNGMG